MTIKIDGIKDVQDVLNNVAPNVARNLMRTTVNGMASQIARDAKVNAPSGATGHVKKNIKAKRRRGKKDEVVSEVHIMQKAAPGSLFYWRFVEKGTTETPERPFIRPAVQKVEAELGGIFRRQFGKQLEKALARQAKRAKAGK